jgi:putative endonuclease
MNRWYVYIVECCDGTYYTGVSTDVGRRVKEHNEDDKRAARYTRARRPVTLHAQFGPMTKKKAYTEEARIKQLSHKEKAQL